LHERSGISLSAGQRFFTGGGKAITTDTIPERSARARQSGMLVPDVATENLRQPICAHAQHCLAEGDLFQS
jgi:hypothetical protein